jgi:hypothetical protein
MTVLEEIIIKENSIIIFRLVQENVNNMLICWKYAYMYCLFRKTKQ